MAVQFYSVSDEYHPQYNHEGDAGADLKAYVNPQPVTPERPAYPALNYILTEETEGILNNLLTPQDFTKLKDAVEELKLVHVPAKSRRLIRTGVFIKDLTIDPDVDYSLRRENYNPIFSDFLILEAQVRPRSGLAHKKGLTVLNTPGTIDSGYRDEIKVNLLNTTGTDYFIEDGVRIAQIVICPVYNLSKVLNIKANVNRGLGGYGSTGN